MPVELIVQLVTQVGLPLATKLIALYEQGGVVTSAQWQQITSEASVGAKQEAANVLKANGIDPASAQGAAILALIK